MIDIATEHQDNILAALAELGLERHGSMSALLDPYMSFPSLAAILEFRQIDGVQAICP
mgnify:CR=1 FL=1